MKGVYIGGRPWADLIVTGHQAYYAIFKFCSFLIKPDRLSLSYESSKSNAVAKGFGLDGPQNVAACQSD